MYWSAFILGLLGSLHCAGMCGPLAVALANANSSAGVLISRILYNLGRVVTYSLIGIVLGTVGKGISLAGWQQAFSILIGLLIMSYLLLGSKWIPANPFNTGQLNSWLKKMLGKYLGRAGFGSSFLTGLLNGLLPCGLVYIALAGAVAAGDVFSGMSYMFVFGMGTFPMMLMISLSGKYFKPLWFNYHRVLSIFLWILALLFILRGMNLGIPYVSPHLALEIPGQEINACS